MQEISNGEMIKNDLTVSELGLTSFEVIVDDGNLAILKVHHEYHVIRSKLKQRN